MAKEKLIRVISVKVQKEITLQYQVERARENMEVVSQ